MKKEEIAKGIYHFFRSGSDLPAIPFRVEDDYYTATENIVKQLSDTEKVKEILQTMQVVLDGTDTADRHYESMQKSFETLQKYSLGKFTLFNGKHRAEEKIIPEKVVYEEAKIPNKENSAEAVIENESRVEAMETLIGQTVVADGRSFIVESVHGDRASLRDTTFQESTGFPIYRNEPLTFVKDHIVIEQASLAEVLQAIEQAVEKRNYHIADTELGTGTPTEKYQNNIAAIRLLKEMESENRLATAEEQAVLAKYVGWGGLADCFSETNRNYVELKSLLTEEEFSSARESTLTAFYTQPTVIRAIYRGLSQMGFETGNILEPSCGTGNFLGLLPESMENSRIYGVELDSISGRIAKQLYQKADVRIQGFENADFSDSFFDVAIGNPPYQMNEGGGDGNSATPIYHNFIKQAKKLNPRYMAIIIPARWYSGGKGLDEFRNEMLHDDRMSVLHDFPETSDCFPGLNIRGGVCYFLWDRAHYGNCLIYNHKQDQISCDERPLLEKNTDTFIRYNAAISILRKVRALNEETMDNRVSSRLPFGIPSNFAEFSLVRNNKDSIVLYRSERGNSKTASKRVFISPQYITIYNKEL